MSDFFISQILVLLLLLLFLIRPFGKITRTANGSPLLPLLAGAGQVAAVFAFGFQVEMIPVVCCCFLVFIASIPQLGRFFVRLPTDGYTVCSRIFYAAGIVAVCAAGFITYTLKPGAVPEPAVPIPVEKRQAVFFESAAGLLREKQQFQDIAQKTAAACSIWSPSAADYRGAPCPVVYYIPGPQTDRHSREITAGILAGNGYVVFAADFPQQQYALPGDSFPERVAGIAALRQCILAYRCRQLTAAQIARNAEWIQRQLKETHAVATAFFSGKTDAAGAAELPPVTLAEPYIIIEQFNGEPSPNLAAAGIAGAGGVVRLCGPGVPAVTEVKTVLYHDLTAAAVPVDSVNYADIVLYSSGASCLPFGEAALNHPLFAAMLNVPKDDNQILKEQMLAHKIRAYFDLRRSRPVPVMVPAE